MNEFTSKRAELWAAYKAEPTSENKAAYIALALREDAQPVFPQPVSPGWEPACGPGPLPLAGFR